MSGTQIYNGEKGKEGTEGRRKVKEGSEAEVVLWLVCRNWKRSVILSGSTNCGNSKKGTDGEKRPQVGNNLITPSLPLDGEGGVASSIDVAAPLCLTGFAICLSVTVGRHATSALWHCTRGHRARQSVGGGDHIRRKKRLAFDM